MLNIFGGAIMIKFTLDYVMFHSGNIKVTELARLSGINKNTLYAIYNNKSKRIDLDVIDRICATLNCTPGDLIQYIPDNY